LLFYFIPGTGTVTEQPGFQFGTLEIELLAIGFIIWYATCTGKFIQVRR
jgi:hypothetical protein